MTYLNLELHSISDSDVALLTESSVGFMQAMSTRLTETARDCDDGGCDDSGGCDDGGCDDSIHIDLVFSQQQIPERELALF